MADTDIPCARSVTRLAHDHGLALLSATQMALADRLTVALGIGEDALMENAGRPVAQAIQRRWTPRPVLEIGRAHV